MMKILFLVRPVRLFLSLLFAFVCSQNSINPSFVFSRFFHCLFSCRSAFGLIFYSSCFLFMLCLFLFFMCLFPFLQTSPWFCFTRNGWDSSHLPRFQHSSVHDLGQGLHCESKCVPSQHSSSASCFIVIFRLFFVLLVIFFFVFD